MPVNNRALCCITDSLQESCLSCICPAYDKDSELGVWKLTMGLLGVYWIDDDVSKSTLLDVHRIGSVRGKQVTRIYLIRFNDWKSTMGSLGVRRCSGVRGKPEQESLIVSF